VLSDQDVREVVGDPREALARGKSWQMEHRTVRDAMRSDPARVDLDTPTSRIALLMDERAGIVPVVDELDRPVGTISGLDLPGA
jgi:CBS domain-containing protein